MHPVWRVHKLTASLETICPHRAIRDSRTTSKDAADLDCLTACMYECECVCVCVCVSWSHMTQEYADHFYGLRLSWCISARVEPVPPECGRCGLQANECTLGGEQIHRTNWQAGRMHAHIQVCHMSPWRLRSKRYRHTHSHAHTNWKCKNGSEQVWKAKAAQMMKKRKQPQANAAPEFASINKPRHTHTHTVGLECVCACFSECGCRISCTDLLRVSIEHGRPTSHARSKVLSQQYTEKWLFISTALHTHKLWTIDFAPGCTHTHTHTHTHTCARIHTKNHGHPDRRGATCKRTVNTCHNKALPATKQKGKFRLTQNTHTYTHTRRHIQPHHLIKKNEIFNYLVPKEAYLHHKASLLTTTSSLASTRTQQQTDPTGCDLPPPPPSRVLLAERKTKTEEIFMKRPENITARAGAKQIHNQTVYRLMFSGFAWH